MIVPIVEGFSEVESLPVLLRRYQALAGNYDKEIARPIRTKRNLVVKPGELEKAIELARRSYPNCSAILTVLDADDDLPCQLGPDLTTRAVAAAGGLYAAVVLPKAEFEAWFLASLESLRGQRGILSNADTPANPEGIRDAKGALTRNMVGKTYIEVDDQPAFAQEFDLDAALAASRSFRKFDKEVRAILALQ